MDSTSFKLVGPAMLVDVGREGWTNQTSPNRVFKCIQHVVSNRAVWCWRHMFVPFDQAFRSFRELVTSTQ